MDPAAPENAYSFDSYLYRRQQIDYYRDDPFLQQVVKHHAGQNWQSADNAARQLSSKASFRWRDLADEAARPENRPYVLHYDGHNHRIDRIVRPMETRVLEAEVFGEALFSEATPVLERLVKMYLIYQNGEACTACPLTCTEGLVAILEAFADTPETKGILAHCREGIAGDFGIGAQFLTEIQGGSDVPANALEARAEKGQWRLYGTKFFCSVTHADYAVVTARPAGSEKIGVFVMPSWLPGDKKRERRNGFTVDRLKWKMGTSELPTAEMTFDGALAYPVGSLEKGLAAVVGIVLTCSRLTVGLSGAAMMTRAAREAREYSAFREAFGRPIGGFPMVAAQVEELEKHARRSTAAAFKIYHRYSTLDGDIKVGIDMRESEQQRRRRLEVRELVMLQKITASWDAVDQLRTAMSIFGGHGVIEDFSSLPRLYRDAAVNELWEGPRNVLLSQIHRDLVRVKSWYPPAAFVRSLLGGAADEVVTPLAAEMEELVNRADLTDTRQAGVRDMCRQWDSLCHRLFHAYQDQSRAEVEGD